VGGKFALRRIWTTGDAMKRRPVARQGGAKE